VRSRNHYKDALAATGAGKILRRYPLVGGIDFAGVVESSADSRYSAGDPVLVISCGLSETHPDRSLNMLHQNGATR
jgi:NADPH:quinone reductase-like Zn-dependent oxidoreductase